MTFTDQHRREAGLALKFGAVGCIGFITDTTILKIGVAAGFAPAAVRIVSLLVAMQVTFLVNGLVVFRCLDARRAPRQWACYMGSNGVGNFCNYWIFLGLISSDLPIVSGKLAALAIGSLTAWAINFIGARIFAFGEKGLLISLMNRARGRVCEPCATEGPAPLVSARVGRLGPRL